MNNTYEDIITSSVRTLTVQYKNCFSIGIICTVFHGDDFHCKILVLFHIDFLHAQPKRKFDSKLLLPTSAYNTSYQED